MKYLQKKIESVCIDISMFTKNNVDEIHLFAKTDTPKNFDEQLKTIFHALNIYLEESQIPSDHVVFTRYFVSDYANQADMLDRIHHHAADLLPKCAISVVQQPPLCANRVAVWAYIIHDRTGFPQAAKASSSRSHKDLLVKRGIYEHLFSTQMVTSNGAVHSSRQTENIFVNYNNRLEKYGYSLKSNCIRTWLFIKDIDFNYPGVVEARRNFFEKLGMTKDTHFIASTGIEGRHRRPEVNVLVDAYLVGGLSPNQVRFLEARTHLNPTHEYGVTFERGTSVDYGDRRHIFISGTASINHKGEILHQEDVEKQVDRTIRNISALLNNAESSLEDVAQMIVYLRDISDAEIIHRYFSKHHISIPKVVVMAPVCRPGWLVEIECIAIKDTENREYHNF